MNEHETFADVLAAMRDEAARADMEQDYSINDAAEMMREFAWRFEEAHKRELGDCAKLREALMYLFNLIDMRKLVLDCDETEEISAVQVMLDECRAALAEPPRNCERFQTTKQAKEAYFAEVRHVSVWDGCETERLVDWLLAHVTEK